MASRRRQAIKLIKCLVGPVQHRRAPVLTTPPNYESGPVQAPFTAILCPMLPSESRQHKDQRSLFRLGFLVLPRGEQAHPLSSSSESSEPESEAHESSAAEGSLAAE